MHLVFLLPAFMITRAFAETDSCTTYKGTRGMCVNIKQCPFLLNLLKRRKLLPKNYVLQRLNQSQCGFERLDPKVCCSIELTESIESVAPLTASVSDETVVTSPERNTCKTANRNEGTCVAVSECPSLHAILSEGTLAGDVALKTLKQSLCGFEKMSPKVCCEDHLFGGANTPYPESHLQVISNQGKQEQCVTPRGSDGICINIKQCRPLFTLLKRIDNLPYELSQTLKELHCGFENMDPKVCCEDERNNSGPIISPNSNRPNDQEQIPAAPDVTNHPNLGLLEHDLCGPISEAKIIGGTKTAVFEFPWMALIAYDTGSGFPEFRCGGSLITKKHVLTAAHCVTMLPPDLRLVGVRLGEHDLSKERDCDDDEDGLEMNCAAGYQDFSIIGVAVHPGYPKDKLQDDIGLVMLDGEADFRAVNVRPICLPVARTSVLNSKMIVTGWGATESGPRSQTLRKVTLPIIPQEECARLYEIRNIKIWHKQICAGGLNRADSCSGDSGGPLQTLGIYHRQPRNILYGVVSFGPRDCGVEGIPGVYTRVEYYMDWILDTIGTEMYDE